MKSTQLLNFITKKIDNQVFLPFKGLAVECFLEQGKNEWSLLNILKATKQGNSRVKCKSTVFAKHVKKTRFCKPDVIKCCKREDSKG